MVGGEYTVHMVVAVFDAVRHDLLAGHAAAEEDLLTGMAAFCVDQSAQIAENPLFRVFPDGAGVHDHHVGPLGLTADGIAALSQQTPELFGIRFILLAAVGFHIGYRHGILVPPIGGDLITIIELLTQLIFRNHSGFIAHFDIPPIILS